MQVDVNRPAADVWKRVGKYCDIGEWFQMPNPCTITSGKDGEFGAVRTVGSEILVGKTELSYTYTQPVREGQRYNMYHGTLEARPVTATTSKLVYTLFFDNSNLLDEAGGQGTAAHGVHARAAEHEDAGRRRDAAPAPRERRTLTSFVRRPESYDTRTHRRRHGGSSVCRGIWSSHGL
jgi:hypothetical protein